MGAAIDRFDFVLSGVLRVIFYRSLHMTSVPVPIRWVLQYAREQANGEGRFGGTVEEYWHGPFIVAYRWNNIKLGDGLYMNIRFVGTRRGPQTGLFRQGFYMGNFSTHSLRNFDPLGLVLPHEAHELKPNE